MVAQCRDATSTADMLFTTFSATQLYWMQASAYAALSPETQKDLSMALHDCPFVVEVLPLPSHLHDIASFHVTNLWDPQAACF
ncbi:hypothetical protein LINGRAHAP2_LOCUS36780 [Linum grandiflorum]